MPSDVHVYKLRFVHVRTTTEKKIGKWYHMQAKGHWSLCTPHYQLQRLAGRLREGEALIPIINAPKCINSGIPFRINSVLLIGIAFFVVHVGLQESENR